MAQQVRLRLCEEHESCQIQSTDGGPWEHTPQDRRVLNRFDLLPGWERDIQDSVTLNLHKASNMRAWAEGAEKRMRSAERLLATLHDVPARMEQLGEASAKAIHDAEERSTRLDGYIDQVETRLARLDAALKQLDEINAVYELIEKSDMERLAYSLDTVKRLDAMDATIKLLVEGLANEEAKRMASSGKLKVRMERVEDLVK